VLLFRCGCLRVLLLLLLQLQLVLLLLLVVLLFRCGCRRGLLLLLLLLLLLSSSTRAVSYRIDFVTAAAAAAAVNATIPVAVTAAATVSSSSIPTHPTSCISRCLGHLCLACWRVCAVIWLRNDIIQVFDYVILLLLCLRSVPTPRAVWQDLLRDLS
jgi:hypothetical protein